MNLDDFADYRISSVDKDTLAIRHAGCADEWYTTIQLFSPTLETNLKWLMIEATNHWQKVHKEDEQYK